MSDQVVAVDEDGASPATLAEHGQVLVVGREVDVLNLQGECLADAEAELCDEAEEKAISATMSGNGGEDRLDLPRAEPPAAT